MDALAEPVEATLLPEQLVKGRETPVRAWLYRPAGSPDRPHGLDRLGGRRPSRTGAPMSATTEVSGDVLVVEGVRKTFEAENAPVRALRGANLRVPAGDFVALMGPSGCGKSTLLNLVAGLDVADEGTIIVGGELVTGRTEDELSLIRRKHIGIVFQFFNLLEGMTALENVALPAIIAGTKRRPAETRARDLLDLLGVGDKAAAVPGSLSGGQRQRLAIARALANEPTLLLADEPTGALDSDSGHEIVELLSRLHRGGQTIVLVTHDDDVAQAAGHLITMRDGRMVEAPGPETGGCPRRGPVTTTPDYRRRTGRASTSGTPLLAPARRRGRPGHSGTGWSRRRGRRAPHRRPVRRPPCFGWCRPWWWWVSVSPRRRPPASPSPMPSASS